MFGGVKVARDIVYSSAFIKSFEDEKNNHKIVIKKAIGIPVIPIKVVMLYAVPSEINHFERAILSLLLNRFYTLEELDETLLLHIDLIALILKNLENKELIDNKWRVTEKGINQFNNVLSNQVSKIEYLLLDLNRMQLFQTNDSVNNLNFSYSIKNRAIMITDARNFEVDFTPIDLYKNVPVIDDIRIENLLKKQWNSSKFEGRNLISISKISVEKKHYLLTNIVTDISGINTSNYSVMDPFTLEVNFQLHDYLVDKSYEDKTIKILVKELLVDRQNRYNINQSEIIQRFIKNELFGRKLDNEHDFIISPLSDVLQILKDTSQIRNSSKKQIDLSKFLRQAVLNLADLFEILLYKAAVGKRFDVDYEKLKANQSKISIYLSTIAKQLGFEVNEETDKLLYSSYRTLLSAVNKTDNVLIGTSCAWNILISINHEDFYFNKLSKKHPYFLKSMYTFKRLIRDKMRHSTETMKYFNIKFYIDLLFDVLDYGFNLQLDVMSLELFLENELNSMDYALSREIIRQKIGSKFYDSIEPGVTRIRNIIISGYDLYELKSPKYISELRSIFEEIVKNILLHLINNYNIDSDFVLNEIVKDETSLSNIIEEIGLESESFIEETSIAKALSISNDCETRIKSGMKERFKNTNFRYKVQALIIFMKLNSKSANEIKPISKLFPTLMLIMFLDKGHNQSNEFYQNHADLVIESSLEVLSSIINKTNIKYWE